MVTYLTSDERSFSIDINEAVRYAGGRRDDARLVRLIEDCVEELRPALTCRACYTTFPITLNNAPHLHLGFTTVTSKDLAKNLAGCTQVILFAATIGAGADRLLQKYSRFSPARAVCLQAAAAAAIEGYCNALNAQLVRPYSAARPRFSPGYGDLPLQLQAEIQKALQFEKIGITLTGGGMMLPSKSVSALIGVEKERE